MATSVRMDAEIRELSPALWPSLEALFGKNGACGGCWCMFWRLPADQRYAALKGPTLKRRFKASVLKEEVQGAIAFVGSTPVGWVTWGPRKSFPRLERSPSLACEDAADVWSVPCFFIKAGFRKQGLATQLLAYAVARMRAHGVTTAEGYPVKPSRDGSRFSASFTYTGTVSMFEKAGFAPATKATHAKVRMRRRLPPHPSR